MPFKKRNHLDQEGLAKQLMLEQVMRERNRRRMETLTSYSEWLPQASPELNWNYPHLQYIQRYIDRVTSGEIKRLLIMLPPQHGKSSLVTVRYPVYRLEKDPTTRIVVWCYGSDLAKGFSRDIRNIVRSRGLVNLDEERYAVEEWMTKEGGYLKAVGVGGGVTGKPADIVIIDDPIKNRAEANSKAFREEVWKSFTDDLYTRQQKDTPYIGILTHWHEDDWAGRILENNPVGTEYEWHVISLPAIAEGTDPIDYPVQRKEGEALCPELHPIQQLREFERVLGSSFAALYQQRPAPAEGDVWLKKWFCEGGDINAPYKTKNNFPDRAFITQVWDTALETKEENDFSAMVEGCMVENGDIYVCAMVNEKLDFPQLAKRMQTEYERVSPMGEVCVEDKASGKPARQQLKTWAGIPVIEIPAGTSDKKARAKSVTQYAEAGHIYFVNKQGNCNNILIDQLLVFDNGRHDDLHDAFVHLIRRLTARSDAWGDDVLQEMFARR